jgi:hypothetical protein
LAETETIESGHHVSLTRRRQFRVRLGAEERGLQAPLTISRLAGAIGSAGTARRQTRETSKRS